MRKLWVFILICSAFFTSCSSVLQEKASANEKLLQILEAFPLESGVIYSTEEGAEYELSDAMAERMFFWEHDISALSRVESAAVYVSRHFSAQEIAVLKLFDLSCREEVMALLELRAAKKENAIVFHDGVYVYLICTEDNAAIKRFLK